MFQPTYISVKNHNNVIMSKCNPGQTLGSKGSQFSCPPESSYYSDMSISKNVTNIETSLTNQDKNVNDILNQANIFQKRASVFLKEQKENPNNFDLDILLADTQKYINSAKQALMDFYISKQEEKALQNAIQQSEIIKSAILQDKNNKKDIIDTKSKIVNINMDAYREKTSMINKLIYIIYYIIFAIAMGLALVMGFIELRVFVISLIAGLIYLIYYSRNNTGGNIFQEYGGFADDTAKGFVKDIIDVVAPMKKCPKRCRKKN